MLRRSEGLRVSLAIKDVGLFKEYVDGKGGALSHCANIRALDLNSAMERTRILTADEYAHKFQWMVEKALPLLGDLEALHIVSLPPALRTPDGEVMLAQSVARLTRLVTLDVRAYFQADRSWVEAFQQLRGLQHVNLAFNRVGVEGARSMCKCFPNLTELVSLFLQGNALGSGEAPILLAEAIGALPRLKELNLASNKISVDGALHLAGAIVALTCLRLLDISRNDFGPKQARSMAEALRPLTGLQHLAIGSNGFGMKGVVRMAASVRTLTRLRHLEIERLQLGAEGAGIMAEAMMQLTELEELDCSSNLLDAEGAELLCETIRSLTRLRDLDLGDNLLADEGARVVAEAIQPLTGLRFLYLERNEMGDGAVQHLTAAIRRCSRLQCLDLTENRFGETGGKRLTDAAALVTCLTDFGFD